MAAATAIGPAMRQAAGDQCELGRRKSLDVKWLSSKTGKSYRLLSEAEWEYGARGGTKIAYSWGDAVGKNNANCDGCGGQWDNKQTAPVGSFKPDAFGLYDMAGNVWEWVEDVYHENYKSAPSNGLRGRSWYVNPLSLRAANRSRVTSDDRGFNLGFRVGRVLTP